MAEPVSDVFITQPGRTGKGDRYLVFCVAADPECPTNRMLHMHRTDCLDEVRQVRQAWKQGQFPTNRSTSRTLKAENI